MTGLLPPSNQRLAIVTGGAVRVGAEIVRVLHGRGLEVIFTYRSSAAEATHLATDLTASGPRATAIWADLSNPAEAVARLADGVESIYPGRPTLEVLVHSASWFPKAALGETTPEMIAELSAVHLASPLLITRAFCQQLRRGRGCVVNILDAGNDRPHPAYIAYHATKAALANLTLSLARELAPEARCNGVAPGAVLWPEDMSEEDRRKFLARVPQRRAGTPADVAQAVAFLALDAAYTSGVILPVDGGRSAV